MTNTTITVKDLSNKCLLKGSEVLEQFSIDEVYKYKKYFSEKLFYFLISFEANFQFDVLMVIAFSGKLCVKTFKKRHF